MAVVKVTTRFLLVRSSLKQLVYPEIESYNLINKIYSTSATKFMGFRPRANQHIKQQQMLQLPLQQVGATNLDLWYM